MKGKVEKIWENDKNGTKYWVLEIGGQRYSVWDSKYVDGLTEGATVEYEWKKSGNFRKITGLTPLEEGLPSWNNEKNRQIVRMSCLRSAVEIINGLDQKPQGKANLALDLAKRFEKYVLNGD